jgi:ABC-type uncharacterized transport system involved in gliding motility auxiliary subunit
MTLSSRTYFWTALGLATAAFFGLNIFANNFFLDSRLDLTQSRQYTLSDGTRAIIAQLPEPVTLRFYFSRRNSADYPATAAYAKRVRDLLGHYAAISEGRIQLEDVDPQPFTPEEDRANAAGLRAAPVANGSGTVYFGLEGSNMVDDSAAIAFFAPEREPYLEYDLTSLLFQLSHPGKRKVAVMSSLPLEKAPGTGQPLGIYADLQRTYDVTKLDPKFRTIPAGTDLLLIAHPQEVVPSQMSAIMRYSLSGGRVLVLVDPMSELVQQEQNPTAPPSSDLRILLQAWGVEYTPTRLVLDRGTAQQIRNPADPQRASVPYPLWQHLTAPNFSKTDPVTASLNGVNLASPGALTPAKGATTKFEPLLTTSTDSMLFSRDETLNLRDPGALMSRMKPGGTPITLAARITGKAVFPNVAQGNVNIVVIADTDVMDDRFWAQADPQSGERAPFADNQGLILNAIESLTGSDDLITLRARGNTERPFTVVRAMQAQAEANYRQTLDSLRSRLAAAQKEFAQLQQGGNAATVSQEQAEAMERVQREMGGTRAQLRDVQANLRAGIDRLGRVLAFLNILMVPMLVAAFALVFSGIRRRRAKRGPMPKPANTGAPA